MLQQTAFADKIGPKRMGLPTNIIAIDLMYLKCCLAFLRPDPNHWK